jgi:hypothetical protein
LAATVDLDGGVPVPRRLMLGAPSLLRVQRDTTTDLLNHQRLGFSGRLAGICEYTTVKSRTNCSHIDILFPEDKAGQRGDACG